MSVSRVKTIFFRETIQSIYIACKCFLAEGFFWFLGWMISGGGELAFNTGCDCPWFCRPSPKSKQKRNSWTWNSHALDLQTTVFVRAATQPHLVRPECRVKKSTNHQPSITFNTSSNAVAKTGFFRQKVLFCQGVRWWNGKPSFPILRPNQMRQRMSCLCMCSFLKIFWISAVDMFSVNSEQLEKTLFSGLLMSDCQIASSRVKVQHSSEFSVSTFSSLSKFLIWIETEAELIS